MSTRRKLILGVGGAYLLTLILLAVLVGSAGKNNEFKPQNEFKLVNWIDGPGPLDFNKGVLYLLIATALTVGTMLYIANRMQARPNRVQTAVEALYSLMRHNITAGSMDDKMARKWFPFIGTLFLFIWFNNLIGYIPLPTNSLEKINIFGAHIPALAIYAATANISIPLALTLVVFFVYTFEGIRAKGPIGYLKSFVPAGVEGPAAVPIFFIEVISNLVRIISLSVRLFANILAGHLLILFMAGGLVVLLGLAPLGVFTLLMAIPFFLFEIGLVATLQAFIFATLTSIYIGGATAEEH